MQPNEEEELKRKSKIRNGAVYTKDHYQISELPQSAPPNGSYGLAGYRSGESERSKWQGGINPDLLASNVYPKGFRGEYLHTNKTQIGDYGSQHSEVFVPAGTPIVRVDGTKT
jgi:hypothetical protein